MNIEPCLYCGECMKELVSGDAQCLGCGAIVEYCNIPLHNRISRIVRAAEEWAGLFMSGVSEEYVPACRALMDAVEGDCADG